MELRKMRWTGHAAKMREKRNENRLLMGMSKIKCCPS
jgi:hypothetical protein